MPKTVRFEEKQEFTYDDIITNLKEQHAADYSILHTKIATQELVIVELQKALTAIDKILQHVDTYSVDL